MSDNMREVLVALTPHAHKIILALLAPPLCAGLVWLQGWPGGTVAGALVTAFHNLAR